MKKYFLPLIACVLLLLSACKKDNSDVQTGAITGKWQETKLNFHQTDGQTVVNDTTFTSADFTNLDFYQFNRDKTAVISKSGDFSLGGKSIVIPAIEVSDWITHYTYNIADTVLNLKPTDQVINPRDSYLQTQTIVRLDNSHMILRSVYSYYFARSYGTAGSKLSGLIATAYFTKL